MLGSEWALAAYLPQNLGSLPLGAQVARIESAFSKVGRDPEQLGSRERQALVEWLTEIADEYAGGDFDPTARQAQRLSEEIAQW